MKTWSDRAVALPGWGEAPRPNPHDPGDAGRLLARLDPYEACMTLPGWDPPPGTPRRWSIRALPSSPTVSEVGLGPACILAAESIGGWPRRTA